MERDAERTRERDDAIDHLRHAADRVPGAEGDVGVVHQAVHRRNLAGGSAQEKDGKLHDLHETRVAEVRGDMAAHGLHHLNPKRGGDEARVQKLI